MLQKQDARLERIEQALIKSNAVNEDDLNVDQASVEELDIFHQGQLIKNVTNRHTEDYIKNIKRGDLTKGSNRNEVLLGEENQVSVGTPPKDKQVPIDDKRGSVPFDQAKEGGEVETTLDAAFDDDCFKRMD